MATESGAASCSQDWKVANDDDRRPSARPRANYRPVIVVAHRTSSTGATARGRSPLLGSRQSKVYAPWRWVPRRTSQMSRSSSHEYVRRSQHDSDNSGMSVRAISRSTITWSAIASET
jgi:hypothetical protein